MVFVNLLFHTEQNIPDVQKWFNETKIHFNTFIFMPAFSWDSKKPKTADFTSAAGCQETKISVVVRLFLAESETWKIDLTVSAEMWTTWVAVAGLLMVKIIIVIIWGKNCNLRFLTWLLIFNLVSVTVMLHFKHVNKHGFSTWTSQVNSQSNFGLNVRLL